jgi:hypothetical protein
MSQNDARDFAQRLYSRLPGHYRNYDAQQGLPLLALLTVVGAQAANLRQDMDALWDNFFIETCEDWVVPYIGALVGTNLLPQSLGASSRLDVWNTVQWRRNKGTPQMLSALSQSISGWPAEVAEFFQALGWSQNLDHVRLNRPLMPDLRDPALFSLLGRAGDSVAHAAEFKPVLQLEQARTRNNSAGASVAAWGTPGRYQIRNLGVFVRRLQVFPVSGVTPAVQLPENPPASPPQNSPAPGGCFFFNPLARQAPLFDADSAAPITRAAFGGDPWASFGSSIRVRQFGIPFAAEAAPAAPAVAPSEAPFNFGAATSIALDAAAGLRLMEPKSFEPGAGHFLIRALWQPAGGGAPVLLGALSTLYAASGTAAAFVAGAASTSPGQLLIEVQAGRPGTATGWTGAPLPASPTARFPGAVVAVRLGRTDAVHTADGLYVYLPAGLLTPADQPSWFVADDGSTYSAPTLNPLSLARASEGQVYPPLAAGPSATAVSGFTRLQRTAGALRVVDPARFAGGGCVLETGLLAAPAAVQILGGLTTVQQPGSNFAELDAPATWPAFTFAPSIDTADSGLLTIRLRPVPGGVTYLPPSELIVVNRAGQSLLVYLPEVVNAAAAGTDFLVADDGSTYYLPADPLSQQAAINSNLLNGLVLARAALGQVVPIAGEWPLQQRLPVAINLCRSERSALLRPGQLGVDPELGCFALPPLDPAIADGNFTVDFVEALSSAVGALNYDRGLDPAISATRLVSQSGDADSPLAATLAGGPIHTTLADAVANARDGDVIEIADSRTYASPAPITIPSTISTLTIRAAAGQRPCLTFYQAPGEPLPASLVVASPMTSLTLNGLLLSGGTLLLESDVAQLSLTSCSLDPTAGPSSLIASSPDVAGAASIVISQSIVGGLQLGDGVSVAMLTNSILGQHGSYAIAGLTAPSSPPSMASARTVQLDRVTAFGTIDCDVLYASECLLDDLATVVDQQTGCVRFTRFEQGSVLPRRYLCLPNEAQASACTGGARCVGPVFNSRHFGSPVYAQLASGCPAAILSASESRAEIGAFAGAQNTIRLRALQTKLQEFMPAGLSAVVVAET